MRQQFAPSLVAAMTARGLTTKELVTRCADMDPHGQGISRDTINRLKSGATTPTPEMVQLVAAALVMDPQDLMPGIVLEPLLPPRVTAMNQLHDGRYWIEIRKAVSLERMEAILGILAQQDAEDERGIAG